MKEQFPTLLSSIQIGSVTVKNRVIMAPMNTNYANPDGSISKRFADYFVERAKGGVGMIIISPGYIDRRSKKRAGSLLFDDERFIPALREFTDRIHAEGSVILQQLNHNGRLLTSSKELKTAGGLCVGPSAVPHLLTGEIPHVLTVEEIHHLEDLFVLSAVNAKAAGYDGVEVHGAHGYLVNQFLSRYSNKREDEYGGTMRNRMRFALEIVSRIREAVGEDFIISFRLCGEEYNPNGFNIDDAVVLAKELEKCGVNLLNLTFGNTESPRTALRMFPPAAVSRGVYAHFAEPVRRAVNIPVSVVGRISSPERAEEILTAGQSDMVTLGRELLCDPYFVRKCMEGRRDEIRQCVACLQGCYERLAREEPLTCLYNPFVGREHEPVLPAEKTENVWIVGGGPAGMEAARVAAMRGHSVTLFERSEKLGGQLPLAAAPPGKTELFEIIRFYEAVLSHSENVTVKTGHEVTVDEIVENAPDAVVLAVGSNSLVLPLPGLDQPNVISGRDALAGVPCGEQVVICGGGQVGIETALYLDEQGKKVDLIEMSDHLAADAGPLNHARLMQELYDNNIPVHTGTRLLAVEGNEVVTAQGDAEVRFPADTVILAMGARADTALEKALAASSYRGRVLKAGDCIKAGFILDATATGATAGLDV